MIFKALKLYQSQRSLSTFRSHSLTMANHSTLCFFFLCLFVLCCSGTLVGLSYRKRGDAGTIPFLKQEMSQSHIRIFVSDPRSLSTFTNSHESLDFYLNETLVKTLISSNPSAVSWLETNLVDFLAKVEIKSIIASCGSLGQNEIPLLVSALKSIHSVLIKLHLGGEVKVSVAFPLSFLEKWKNSNENDLHKILSFIKETNSFVMIEDSIDGETSLGERFVQSAIKRATHAVSILPHKDVPLFLTIKSEAIPSSIELAQFTQTVCKHLEATSTKVSGRVIAFYAEVHAIEAFEQEQLKREEEIFPLSHREILSKFHIRRTLDDITSPPNQVFPTNPTSATPIVTTPDTPTIITVPSTIPAPPTNPAAMPMTVPTTTSVPLPPTNPANPGTTPITVPGAQPETYYPPPSVGVPVVNSISPPATSNAPATSGQSWCIAKTGAAETALQSALDYACGMGADCSQIQQSGNCYNPNTLENHASYAFNSYYQKNPAPTSCDFGGAATLVNGNPSTGSCIFPSSSSSLTSSTPTTTTSSTPTPTSTTSSGTDMSGYGTPPSVLNSSSSSASSTGTSPFYGSGTPPGANTASSSHSASLQPFLSFIVLVISLVTGNLSMCP